MFLFQILIPLFFRFFFATFASSSSLFLLAKQNFFFLFFYIFFFFSFFFVRPSCVLLILSCQSSFGFVWLKASSKSQCFCLCACVYQPIIYASFGFNTRGECLFFFLFVLFFISLIWSLLRNKPTKEILFLFLLFFPFK